MKILVTGKNGQLARSLAVRAQGHDIEIVLAGRPEIDHANPSTFVSVLKSVAPHLVINAAAHTGVDQQEDEPQRAFRINAEAPAELARLTRLAAIPIIQVSTDYVFDGKSSEPYAETDKPNPQTVYGLSKLAGEQAVRSENPDHLVVRTAWVFSRYGRNFVKTILSAAQTRKRLQVVADQFGNPTEAHDLADGLLAAARFWREHQGFLQGLYHLAGQGRASWYEVARQILEISKAMGGPIADVEPIVGDQWVAKAPRPANSELNSERFAHDFGYRAGDWRDRVSSAVGNIIADSVTCHDIR
ncbi:dTDP-4-dehydrorhamnose reductase [Pseudaminobacter sp. 19-2017]|uniref:dTDP-4-dehydrorhamnose reductase n=1 Tax=Pseudaminobacter soli (ex Zhang et al. 2022) TaxID=2831468 RepID=A0A942IBF4_9HYPH|nr:dTDP-4-dehydrorhamnose reductase [Pseudaminobacter soli]MBS3651546.1 dTDP-4-dehydrorhamnose reductase [Pseudaminobacter soli]